MDCNIVVLSGRLAAPPDHRVVESGGRLMRLLITTRRDEPPRRVDVVPVSYWDPPFDLLEADVHPGAPMWVVGRLQRRFQEGAAGRTSRLEVVAMHAESRAVETDEAS